MKFWIIHSQTGFYFFVVSCFVADYLSCRTDFCWLCSKPLDQMDVLNHFVSMSGCTLYGAQPWSDRKVKLMRRTSPLWVPLMIGAGAIALPFIACSLPFAVLQDNDAQATDSQPQPRRRRRMIRSVSIGLTTFIFGTPALVLMYTGVALKGLFFAYAKMPYREARALCGKKRRTVIDLVPHSALESCHLPQRASLPTNTSSEV
eukprot:m.82158 g.82158  ORF g.82158 m.82158 type:complete len:203 (+) comp14284_c0_seq3:777-1385(+)